MAKNKSDEDELSISIGMDGESLPFGKFLSIQKDFLDIVIDVSKSYFEDSGVISWSVLHAGMSSPYKCKVEVRPRRSHITKDDTYGLIEAINYGFESIEKNAQWPPFFSEKSVKKIKRMGDSIDGRRVSRVFIGGNRKNLEFSDSLIMNVTNLLAAKYEVYDSVQGKLESINLHRRRAFRLYQGKNESEGLLCNFPEELKEEAKNALEKVVYIYGLCREREDGKKVSMEVREIEVLPYSYELPSVEEILLIGRE
ncbi:MAG: hypothetical protein AAF215_26150 [Cyanobacteria bacterium P01_A01_bin.123]